MQRTQVSIKVNDKERWYAPESQYMFCTDSGRDGQGGVTGQPGVPMKDHSSRAARYLLLLPGGLVLLLDVLLGLLQLLLQL